MNFKACLFLIIMSCGEITETPPEFSDVRLINFIKRQMETNQSSFIIETQDSIALALKWEKLESNNIVKIRIYKQNENNSFDVLTEITNENTEETQINSGLVYEQIHVFAMTVIDNEGNESSLSNSNTARIALTNGKPAMLSSHSITWDVTSIVTNPLINVDNPRNNIFDSLSLNILYKEEFSSGGFKKIMTLFGDLTELGELVSFDQGVNAIYQFDNDTLRNRLLRNELEYLPDYDTDYFSDPSEFSNLFLRNGEYRFYVYLYKQSQGVEYVYKSDLFDVFEIN